MACSNSDGASLPRIFNTNIPRKTSLEEQMSIGVPIADLRRTDHMLPMLRPEIVSLARALADTRELLRRYGDRGTAPRLEDLERRLDRGDTMAIVAAVSEATGGMGSLRDRYLAVENGDTIQPDEIEAVNRRLHALVEEVERSARVAAAALDIELVR